MHERQTGTPEDWESDDHKKDLSWKHQELADEAWKEALKWPKLSEFLAPSSQICNAISDIFAVQSELAAFLQASSISTRNRKSLLARAQKCIEKYGTLSLMLASEEISRRGDILELVLQNTTWYEYFSAQYSTVPTIEQFTDVCKIMQTVAQFGDWLIMNGKDFLRGNLPLEEIQKRLRGGEIVFLRSYWEAVKDYVLVHESEAKTALAQLVGNTSAAEFFVTRDALLGELLFPDSWASWVQEASPALLSKNFSPFPQLTELAIVHNLVMHQYNYKQQIFEDQIRSELSKDYEAWSELSQEILSILPSKWQSVQPGFSRDIEIFICGNKHSEGLILFEKPRLIKTTLSVLRKILENELHNSFVVCGGESAISSTMKDVSRHICKQFSFPHEPNHAPLNLHINILTDSFLKATLTTCSHVISSFDGISTVKQPTREINHYCLKRMTQPSTLLLRQFSSTDESLKQSEKEFTLLEQWCKLRKQYFLSSAARQECHAEFPVLSAAMHLSFFLTDILELKVEPLSKHMECDHAKVTHMIRMLAGRRVLPFTADEDRRVHVKPRDILSFIHSVTDILNTPILAAKDPRNKNFLSSMGFVTSMFSRIEESFWATHIAKFVSARRPDLARNDVRKLAATLLRYATLDWFTTLVMATHSDLAADIPQNSQNTQAQPTSGHEIRSGYLAAMNELVRFESPFVDPYSSYSSHRSQQEFEDWWDYQMGKDEE